MSIHEVFQDEAILVSDSSRIMKPLRHFMIWHSLLRGGPLELDLMSVAKIQVSLVRLVRSTILESLPACLFMDLCGLTKPDSSSRIQIRTPLLIF